MFDYTLGGSSVGWWAIKWHKQFTTRCSNCLFRFVRFGVWSNEGLRLIPMWGGSIKINHGGRQRGKSEANNAGWCVKRIWSRQCRNIFAVNCPLFFAGSTREWLAQWFSISEFLKVKPFGKLLKKGKSWECFFGPLEDLHTNLSFSVWCALT